MAALKHLLQDIHLALLVSPSCHRFIRWGSEIKGLAILKKFASPVL